jgi:ABC-type phosphate/phosphonate transport system substrate-binding protein/rhodanese-related sulfurtransferase
MKLVPTLALAAGLAVAANAAAQVQLNVSGEAREEVNTPQFHDRYQSLAAYLGASLGSDVKLTVGRDLSRELQKMRAGMYEVLVGPAHVIGSAMRYGYEPVARFPGEEKAVFVASKASGVTSLDKAQGKRLALPPTDSLATYLARGELNARGIKAREYFSETKEHRFHEVALLAVEFGQADIAIADERLAKAWIEKNGGTIILETRPTPGVGIAVNKKLEPATKERVKAALLNPNPKIVAAAPLTGLNLSGAKAIGAKEYEYVSTLGYFTPRDLPGATLVTAAQVDELMKKGAVLYDTRTPEEYGTRHIKGARLLPYVEKSPKEVGFDVKLDKFDVSQLAQDKNAAVIFACNGAECWKSYKASFAAINAGYKRVYWFRGGYPEWSLQGLPTDTAPALAKGN